MSFLHSLAADISQVVEDVTHRSYFDRLYRSRHGPILANHQLFQLSRSIKATGRRAGLETILDPRLPAYPCPLDTGAYRHYLQLWGGVVHARRPTYQECTVPIYQIKRKRICPGRRTEYS